MGSFTVRRAVTVAADPALLHQLLNDFREWRAWSPWEDADPALERTYSGAARGVGAHYAWSGNRRAGSGSMEITGSTPERVDVALSFVRPFRAINAVTFTLTPEQGGTEVVWTMTGEQTGVAGVVGRLVGMDRLVGKDFDRGLARLKDAAEA